MPSLAYEVFKLGYQISPIMLVNGVASQIPGQMLPIVAVTQAADYTEGLLSSGNALPALDQFFAHWKPLPGTTLIENQIGQYPFANAATAANAVIAQPLQISMQMNCPVQTAGGYPAKLATLTVLQQTLLQHNNAGGTYVIVTPGQVFSNCLLLRVRDISGGESHQVQHTWQFDFLQPLITINEAQQVYNSLMNKIANGLPTPNPPVWSGPSATVGAVVAGSSGGSTLLPSASNLVAGTIPTVTAANPYGLTAGSI
ncbi:hypothetical protein [Paraburkholderia sp. C35]|uniref:hypothetical protein n=1 Tax=Paraburkholderia sp. C35 TaxID=2126993 RepID=UPI00194DF736|nr:hypothetical protein [Paraburkholderia sp. C35]